MVNGPQPGVVVLGSRASCSLWQDKGGGDLSISAYLGHRAHGIIGVILENCWSRWERGGEDDLLHEGCGAIVRNVDSLLLDIVIHFERGSRLPFELANMMVFVYFSWDFGVDPWVEQQGVSDLTDELAREVCTKKTKVKSQHFLHSASPRRVSQHLTELSICQKPCRGRIFIKEDSAAQGTYQHRNEVRFLQLWSSLPRS